jgi:hypothetical protein
VELYDNNLQCPELRCHHNRGFLFRYLRSQYSGPAREIVTSVISIMGKKVASKKIASKRITSKKITSKETAPKDIAPKEDRNKSKWTKGPPPDSKHTSNPVLGLGFPGNAAVSSRLRNSLLPYIAQGFHPIPTPGNGNLCGFNALADSLHAARVLAHDPARGPIEKVTSKTLQTWKKGRKGPAQVWLDAIAAFRARNIGMPASIVDEQVAEFNQPNNLDQSTMAVLLDAINRHLGTNYDLGYIFGGYRVRWNFHTGSYDNDFLLPSTTQNASHDAAPGETRPMIWLWNNNSTAICEAHRKSNNAIGHWCGMSPQYKATNDWAWHRAIATDWQLEDAARDQVDTGVWVVHRAFPANGVNELPLYQGVFVRQAVPPVGLNIPVGHMYMSTTDDANVGLVPLDNLTKIAFSSVSGAKGVVKIEEDPKKINFQVFRAIESTDKIGAPYPPPVNAAKRFIDGFDYANGDFLFDEGAKGEENTSVKKITGESGRAKLRNLQSLRTPWGSPWGLPQGLPKAGNGKLGNVTLEGNTKDQLVAAAKARNLDYSGNKKPIFDRIAEFDSRSQLPMYRVMAAVPAVAGPPKMPPFLATEVVLKYRNGDAAPGDTREYVKDYEGQTGRIAVSNLVQIPFPWRLSIDPEALGKILDNMTDGKTVDGRAGKKHTLVGGGLPGTDGKKHKLGAGGAPGSPKKKSRTGSN